MKKIILTSILLIACGIVYSQHLADNWYFGVNAGINFNNGIPTAVSGGALVTNEGCSSATDSLGNLLFYTDGISVWDKNNVIMPNGTGLFGGTSATQSALVVPSPANVNEYYIFTVDEIGGPHGFCYSIVDMTLQGGIGDVATKNIPILSNVTEKLTAVSQLGTGNYWVMVHEWGSNAFYAYNLTATGLSAIPVISNTGIVHTTDSIQNTYGQMKFNTCGTKIALTVGYLDTTEVFDFDPLTGIVSNPLTLPMGNHVYGLEFSGDGQKLYVTKYIIGTVSYLVQFDLSLGSAAAIISSETIINSIFDPDYYYGLQLAPDGKIYVSKNFKQFLGVVNDPDQAGTSCNYIDNGFDLDPNFNGMTSALSLPGFVQSTFRGEVVCTITGINENAGNVEDNFIFPNPSSVGFTLSNSKNQPIEEIIVYDDTGRLMADFKAIPANSQFTFGQSLSAGFYFAEMRSQGKNLIRKIVKIE